MSTPFKAHKIACAIDVSRTIGMVLALAMAGTATAQTALDTVSVSIPEENQTPTTDITVFKEKTANGYRISVINTGPEAVNRVIVQDSVGTGLACRPSAQISISISDAPSRADDQEANTIANLIDQGIEIDTLNSGQTATLNFTCQGN